jgi:hypothetical protein
VRPSPVLYIRSPTPFTVLVAARHAAPTTCTPRDKQTRFSERNKGKRKIKQNYPEFEFKLRQVNDSSQSNQEIDHLVSHKKGKVLGTGVIKVNDCFTLNDVALVDRLRYNLLSVSQLCDADLSVVSRKADSHVLDSSGKRVCGIYHIENVF